MTSPRNLLFFAFLFVSYLLFNTWQNDQLQRTNLVQGSASTNASDSNANSDIPSDRPVATSSENTVSNNTVLNDVNNIKIDSEHNISVKTDVLDLTINTIGGDITSALLLKYPKTLESTNEYVQLLQQDATHTYVAQSGLIGADGIDTSKGRAVFTATQKSYQLLDGEGELRIPLTLEKNGVTYTKTFILKPNSYAIDVEYNIDNKTESTLTVEMYAQLKQTILEDTGSMAMPTYRGAAFSDDEKDYQKYPFTDMESGSLKSKWQCLNCQYNPALLKEVKSRSTDNAWVGMLQHYFASAWVPRSNHNTIYTSADKASNQARIGVQLNPIMIEPGKQGATKATLWVGPKIQSEMAKVTPSLAKTVDYGYLWFIAQYVHMFLVFIQTFVGNWGVAIILLTFCIRGAMYPLTKKQYTSMAKMKMLQPQLKELQERLGEDKQRLSQEMMALYKKEKVNPLGGCLPLLIQMPIFISLYWALMESVELRHAPFFLWIQDLSAQDPYYILPVLMGVSMFMIQKMSPTTVTDPMQQKIMTFMPVMFSVFFLFFPSGLVLYYLMSNIVTVVQQTLIYRALEKKGLHSRK